MEIRLAFPSHLYQDEIAVYKSISSQQRWDGNAFTFFPYSLTGFPGSFAWFPGWCPWFPGFLPTPPSWKPSCIPLSQGCFSSPPFLHLPDPLLPLASPPLVPPAPAWFLVSCGLGSLARSVLGQCWVCVSELLPSLHSLQPCLPPRSRCLSVDRTSPQRRGWIIGHHNPRLHRAFRRD